MPSQINFCLPSQSNPVSPVKPLLVYQYAVSPVKQL